MDSPDDPMIQSTSVAVFYEFYMENTLKTARWDDPASKNANCLENKQATGRFTHLDLKPNIMKLKWHKAKQLNGGEMIVNKEILTFAGNWVLMRELS